MTRLSFAFCANANDDANAMTVAVPILPSQQLAALNDAYRKAVARKRLRFTLATAVFFAALVVAAVGAEVNLRTFFTYFGNFVSYFDRIFTLESGSRVWTDIVEWFWGWRKWLVMLGETILPPKLLSCIDHTRLEHARACRDSGVQVGPLDPCDRNPPFRFRGVRCSSASAPASASSAWPVF